MPAALKQSTPPKSIPLIKNNSLFPSASKTPTIIDTIVEEEGSDSDQESMIISSKSSDFVNKSQNKSPNQSKELLHMRSMNDLKVSFDIPIFLIIIFLDARSKRR